MGSMKVVGTSPLIPMHPPNIRYYVNDPARGAAKSGKLPYTGILATESLAPKVPGQVTVQLTIQRLGLKGVQGMNRVVPQKIFDDLYDLEVSSYSCRSGRARNLTTTPLCQLPNIKTHTHTHTHTHETRARAPSTLCVNEQ